MIAPIEKRSEVRFEKRAPQRIAVDAVIAQQIDGAVEQLRYARLAPLPIASDGFRVFVRERPPPIGDVKGARFEAHTA